MTESDSADLEAEEPPKFRATIVGRRLTMIFWHPGLISPSGPGRHHFDSRDRAGVCIADLTILRTEADRPELVVKILARGRPEAVDVLLGWAATIGYRRVWLSDRVVELDGTGGAFGTRVGTRCPSCRSRWEDGEPEFWLTVRRWGNFPAACPLCGGDLPQWEAAKHRPGAHRAPRNTHAEAERG